MVRSDANRTRPSGAVTRTASRESFGTPPVRDTGSSDAPWKSAARSALSACASAMKPNAASGCSGFAPLRACTIMTGGPSTRGNDTSYSQHGHSRPRPETASESPIHSRTAGASGAPTAVTSPLSSE